MYGSAREVLTGLLRALPDPGQPGAGARASDRAPAAAGWLGRQRPALTAACEVAGMLAERVGAPASVPGLLAYLTERWDGKGPLRRAKGEQIPLPMRIVHVANDAAFQRLLGGVEHAARLVRERAGHAFDPEVAACLVDDGVGDPRARPSARRRGTRSSPASRAPAGAGGGGARSRARGDGQLRRPHLPVSRRPLGRRRGARCRGGAALRDRCGGCDGDPAGGASSTTSAGSRSRRGSGRSPGR